MKISVLIAAHGSDEHIAAALTSVRTQSHADWEVIVVDQGARSHTETIVRQFAADYPATIFEHLPNNPGLTAARNRLVELATGDAIAFLEPADAWALRHLTNAVQHLDAGGDIVISNVRVPSPKLDRPPADVAMPAQLAARPARTIFARDLIPSISCIVMRRAVALNVGRFDRRFRFAEVRDFLLRCAVAGAKFALTQRQTCHCGRAGTTTAGRPLIIADETTQFYEKHRDLAAVPAALRRRLLAGSLVAQGRLLRASDPGHAARCFWRAWSLQPVHVQTLGQFALTGWRSTPPNQESKAK